MPANIESKESLAVKQSKATQPKAKNLDPLHGAYSKCIDVAVQAGKISKAMGQEILKADSPEDAISNLVKIYRAKKRKSYSVY